MLLFEVGAKPPIAPYCLVGRLADAGARDRRGDAGRTCPRRSRPLGTFGTGQFVQPIASLRRGRAFIAPGIGSEPELRAGSRPSRGAPEAIDSAEHALRLSPRDRHVGTYASLTMANVHFTAGRYPECVTSVRNVIEKSPEWLQGHAVLTAALGLAGDLTAAAEARDTLLRLRPDYSLTWTLKSHSRPPPAGGRVDQKDPMGVWLATGAL